MFRSSGTKKVAPTLLGPNRVGATLLLPEVQWLKLTLSTGPNRVGTTFFLPEDWKRSSFWKAVFFFKLDDGQSP
jgi:hypothetical protein